LLGFNGNRKNGTAANGTPSEQRESGNSGTTVSVLPSSQSAFRLRVRALIGPLTRRGRTETVSWRRPGSQALKRASLEELQHELNRCRRYGHSLFVARIPFRGKGDARLRRSQEAASMLSSILRSVDRAWADGPDVFVLLPECDHAMGARALERIRQPLSRLLSDGEQEAISSVVFPDKDCLTSGALIDALVGRAAGRKARGTGQEAEIVDINRRPAPAPDKSRRSALSPELEGRG
jgi:hypothetical protein